jgi:hypothetical protein
VRYLLDHGADIHQQGNLEGHDGFTAFHTAAEKGINTKQTSLMFSFYFWYTCWLLVQSLSCFSFLADIPWSIGNSSGESLVGSIHNCGQWHHIQQWTNQNTISVIRLLLGKFCSPNTIVFFCDICCHKPSCPGFNVFMLNCRVCYIIFQGKSVFWH